jgi:hypothetical protein
LTLLDVQYFYLKRPTMKTFNQYVLTIVAAAALCACGGGGSDAPAAGANNTNTGTPAPGAGGGTAATATAPSPSAAPTAEIANTQTASDALKAEALSGYTAAKSAANGAGVKGPLGSASDGLPTGVTGSLDCSLYGGTGNITYDYPSTAIGAGTEIVYSYNACKISGSTFNGVYRLKYTRFTSSSDFAYTASYENFTIATAGQPTQNISGSQSYDYANGVVSTFYSDGTRGWSSNLTYSNGVVNGSYAVAYGSGTVTVKYTNFGPTSGTVEISGANGSKILMTRTSASAFTVKLTDKAGVVTTYSYT